jgi:hypothetical protein
MKTHPCFIAMALALACTAPGAITISGVADKTKYNNTVTFTVTADPNAATTTATVDELPVAVGSAVTVTAISYHELRAESRTSGGALVDSRLIRFIVRDNAVRGDTESGIPPHTPFNTVNDAPSAFAGQTLNVIAPAAWPVGLPIPIAAVLRSAGNETVRLNGVVEFAAFPQTTLQMRRGWGSVLAPAASAAGVLNLAAAVNGLADNPAINIEAGPVFTNVSGTIAANTNWPANSRIYINTSAGVTINAGVTLTIGAGSIVKIYSGTATNGSAAEIVVNGTLQINGADGNPVVFAPDVAGGTWGGIELPAATSQVIATHTMFTGSGEDETWFSTRSGYSTHKPQQALFLIAGSGSGTAVGAQIHLTNCYCFSLAGQAMNSKTNTWIDLSRTLMQRAVTCGELNDSKVTIDRCALIEFPSEDATFADSDNDAIYLTGGDLSLTNTVIGFTKDDGVDSGGNGGDNPFTAASDVTPFLSQNNWYEGTFHEGNSLSGTRNVTFSSCVFLNCGQGVEDGYSASATGDGPNALVDGCLFVSNMVGVRWGDNYGSGYSYNASMEVKNSILLHSFYKDAFSGNWHPTAANGWIYQTTNTNTFGRQYFNVHSNYLSQPDPVHHPANTPWNPAMHGNLLAPFMPVPGANVGVAISSYAPAQDDPANYPGNFTIRLSTFSSQTVTIDYHVAGKINAFANDETTLATGSLTFLPGETLKTIAPTVANPGTYELLRVALTNPINAEVTGGAWYFRTADPALIAAGSSGWRYRETRSEPPASWKTLQFDDTSPAATEWLAATLPAGFGNAAVVTTVASGSSSDRTKAFYFRKKFNVADPSRVAALSIRLRRDDAAVVYLNNDPSPTLVSADGAFNPPYSYDATTIAANNVPNSTNTGDYLSYSIPPAKLVAGTNILAISLHQTSLTSSDILLDCELLATSEQPLTLNLTSAAGEPVLWWFDTAALLEESADLVTWVPVPGGVSPVTFIPTEPKLFYRLKK